MNLFDLINFMNRFPLTEVEGAFVASCKSEDSSSIFIR